MLIGSGIDQKHYHQALKIIMEQIKDMEEGKISDSEFTAATNAIITSLKVAKDDPGQLVDYYLGNAVAGADYSIDDFIDHIRNVALEDVIEVSKRVKADTVYLLSPKEGDS